jgi:hypothetical protein
MCNDRGMLFVASRLAKVFPRILRSLASRQRDSSAGDTLTNQVNQGDQLAVLRQHSEKLGDMRDSGTRGTSAPGGCTTDSGIRATSRAAAP